MVSQMKSLEILKLNYCSFIRTWTPELLTNLECLHTLYIENSYIGVNARMRSKISMNKLLPLKDVTSLKHLKISDSTNLDETRTVALKEALSKLETFVLEQ